jgi:hypothetical protein
MKGLSSKWQKLIVWLTGYANIIAFFVAGGYVYLNTEDDDVKGTAKSVLYLVAVFTGIELLRSLVYNVLSVAGADYGVLNALTTISMVVAALKMVTFAVLFIFDMCGKKLINFGGNDEN